MPPVNANTKILSEKERVELTEKLCRAFRKCGVVISDERKRDILESKDAADIQFLARFNNSAKQLRGQKISDYDEYAVKGAERFATYYLDTTGDADGERRNREFLEGIQTEEGKRRMVEQSLAAILDCDPQSFKTTYNFSTDIHNYLDNRLAIDLGFVGLMDIINGNRQWIPDEVADAYTDRAKLFQNASPIDSELKIASHYLFTAMPKLTDEEIRKIQDVMDDNDDQLENIFGTEELGRDVERYLNMISSVPEPDPTAEWILEKYKTGAFTHATVASDENGKRISFEEAKKREDEGMTVKYREDEATAEKLKIFSFPAMKCIKAPSDGMFSDRALATTGKGFSQICSRLKGVMDGAKLWYTSGSEEFVNINRLLSETANGDPLNKEQAYDVMQELLVNCDRYIENKSNISNLKEREIKRLNAVQTVRNTIAETFNTAKRLKSTAEFNRRQSDLGLVQTRNMKTGEYGATILPLHSAQKNQKGFAEDLNSKSERYRNRVAEISTEKGAAGKLAASVLNTVDILGRLAVKPPVGKAEEFRNGSLNIAIAEMGLLELISEERRSASDEKPIENKFDSFFTDGKCDEQKWKNALIAVSETDTVRKLSEDIAESPTGASRYLAENGPDKLLADLKKELKLHRPSKENVNGTVAAGKGKRPEEPAVFGPKL